MQRKSLEDFRSKLNPSLDYWEAYHSAPSNIALVKYWGKFEPQLPANASISFTLSKALTSTKVVFTRSEKQRISVALAGVPTPSFIPKIELFLKQIAPYCGYLSAYSLSIETTNSFPHSSGIASSASGMAALAMAICDLEAELSSNPLDRQKASFLARLGSGSAARSIEGPIVSWGKHRELKDSSDLYGTLFNKVAPVFSTYCDTILLVHKGVKSVSSSVGHGLMNNHPFAEQRFAQANHNLGRLLRVLESGDLEAFIEIVELEALSLHAMMLSSTPNFILMQPGTLSIIQKVREYRMQTKIPVCFTLDAGANVHLLYPESVADSVSQFIEAELKTFCEEGQYLTDQCGQGAV
jgi:diphosphomevalonate decarboxylase